MPRCSGAWGAALGEAREWCPLLPCLEDPLPASSRKPSRVARACPTTCSHQLHNCWALESSRLGRGRGSRNVCSHSNREGGMMPPDLNLAQPIGHGLVTQACPLPAAAAWEQGEAQGRGAGGPARFQLCQPGLGPSGLCPVSVCPPHCPQPLSWSLIGGPQPTRPRTLLGPPSEPLFLPQHPAQKSPPAPRRQWQCLILWGLQGPAQAPGWTQKVPTSLSKGLSGQSH